MFNMLSLRPSFHICKLAQVISIVLHHSMNILPRVNDRDARCLLLCSFILRRRGLQLVPLDRWSLRMTRNMVKLKTKVTLRLLRSPPWTGRAKLTRSASIINTLGRIRVTMALNGLIDKVTWLTMTEERTSINLKFFFRWTSMMILCILNLVLFNKWQVFRNCELYILFILFLY